MKGNDKISNTRPRRGPGSGLGPMIMPTEKPKDFKGTLKRLLGYLKPFKYHLFVVVITSILGTGFSVVSPKIMGKITTELFSGTIQRLHGLSESTIDFGYILNILLTLCGLYILSALFNYIQQVIMATVAQKTVYNMRSDVSKKLSKLPLKFYDTHTHGEILSRITNDIDNISNTLQQSITQLISSIITLIGIIVMMLTISPIMTLILLVTLPLYAIVTKNIAKKSQKYFSEQQKSLGKLNGHIEEMYTGHRIVKAFSLEEKSKKYFDEINNQLYNAGWKADFISGVIMPLMNFVNNIGYVIISVVGGLLATKGAINIGDIQAFIQYSRQFTHPIIQTANIANIIQSTIASSERVFELLDETEEIPDSENGKSITKPLGNVVFEDVKFAYKQDEPLIEAMNINVSAGQTIAIVGPTGAGKTTLVNLLMRFYEIDGGTITIDGVNIKDMTREHLRSVFGMVLQDTWLFKGTIKENIGYGRKDASDDEIISVAKAARADYFIRTLPDGYDTILTEEASNISQGQKQLLTIARALLADPAILILDEATSSVDTRTEVHIQKAMNLLMKGRTSFVIAHRLSTIKDADLILVMNDGNIIEKGNHQELLAHQGFYAELYNSQFTGKNIIASGA
ncbi:ABC transporter ATP-binding protein [Serpentinicella alkaliphila]|uniref:ATP-binding cassette subfamily B protein n=1 Tax=Serpentinicella alkaliphila TaxID=1734049 RepID=A0A4R2T8P1_9FIRM|nr:ABC transporter ATP-binding protein [Serpentinicella alkaliphila]QUH25739.1 ABC transporter ATP-binding protein [Serpentinicella alkaliphila]TCP99010.1 ATP-binding cassette subfamily B protein [Serpentinicella alkaliphila]